MSGRKKRMTDREVIRMALDDAIEWNVSLLDAIGPDNEHALEVRQDIQRLRELRAKRYGKRVDPFEGAELVPIQDLIDSRADKEPTP